MLRGSPLLVFSVSGGGKDGGNLAHGSVRGRMFGRFLQLKLVKSNENLTPHHSKNSLFWYVLV